MAGSRTEHVWRLLDRLGEPPLWTFQVRWDELQTAVVAGDVEGVCRSAKAMDALGPPGDRAAALVDVAAAWADLVRGRVDGGFVERAATRLGEVGLTWEASRVAGSAAVRTDEPGVMRRLLGIARDLQASPRSTAGPQPATGLSAREREVASYVLTGMTHKQIGGQLFISPKTVEHHVARIRQKLGVNSREELLAAIVQLERPTS
jgi:DNA-binding CsgD family transcriptional regulator